MLTPELLWSEDKVAQPVLAQDDKPSLTATGKAYKAEANKPAPAITTRMLEIPQ